MHYSVPDAARLLGVSEDLVYEWIRNEGLPATFFGGRYHLNNVKLIDWAHHKHFPLAVEGPLSEPVLEDALRRGGVLSGVPGVTLHEALSHLFRDRLGLDPKLGQKIVGMLPTRPGWGWSVDQAGIALPSLSCPLVVLPESSRVYLVYLDQVPSDLLPVSALFVLLVAAHAMHINLLSRCLFSLRNPAFHDLVVRRSDAESLIQCMRGFTTEPKPLAMDDLDSVDLS